MSHLIDSALVKAFDDGAFGLPFSSENREYDPVPGTAWAQLFIVPNQPSINTMGSDGQDLIEGFMQINLNYPVGDGDGTAKQKATAIRDYFKAGTKFTYSTVDVFIASAGRGIAQNIDSWYRVVVTINWYSRLTR
jgi:hypothetical protein